MLSLFAFLISIGPLHAQEILDQSSPVVGRFTSVGADRGDVAQVFDVGITGQLTRVDLQLATPPRNPDAPLILDIRTTTGNAPIVTNDGSLADSSVMFDSFDPVTISFDLSNDNLFVVEGDQLAMAIRSESTRWYAILGSTGNAYPAGESFERESFSSDPWIPITNDFDAAFSTFITVPEPAQSGIFVATILWCCRYCLTSRRRSTLKQIT